MSAISSLENTNVTATNNNNNSVVTKWLQRFVATKNDSAATIARVALGLIMFPHGAQKALGWFGGYGFSGTYGFFTAKLGVPGPLAVAAIAAEFLGALALITGIGSRLAAFSIAAVMLVAIFMVHLSNGFFMNWSGSAPGEGFEYHLLALALSAIVIVKGGGAASLDRKIAARLY